MRENSRNRKQKETMMRTGDGGDNTSKREKDAYRKHVNVLSDFRNYSQTAKAEAGRDYTARVKRETGRTVAEIRLDATTINRPTKDVMQAHRSHVRDLRDVDPGLSARDLARWADAERAEVGSSTRRTPAPFDNVSPQTTQLKKNRKQEK
jgi:hypothetical protein